MAAGHTPRPDHPRAQSPQCPPGHLESMHWRLPLPASPQGAKARAAQSKMLQGLPEHSGDQHSPNSQYPQGILSQGGFTHTHLQPLRKMPLNSNLQTEIPKPGDGVAFPGSPKGQEQRPKVSLCPAVIGSPSCCSLNSCPHCLGERTLPSFL